MPRAALPRVLPAETSKLADDKSLFLSSPLDDTCGHLRCPWRMAGRAVDESMTCSSNLRLAPAGVNECALQRMDEFCGCSVSWFTSRYCD